MTATRRLARTVAGAEQHIDEAIRSDRRKAKGLRDFIVLAPRAFRLPVQLRLPKFRFYRIAGCFGDRALSAASCSSSALFCASSACFCASRALSWSCVVAPAAGAGLLIVVKERGRAMAAR